MFKRFSKLVCILVLGISFSINAYADDSSNIANIATNTANTAARLNTIMQNYLADIKSDVQAIETNVGNIKTAVANTITSTLNTISTNINSIKGYVDGIEGYIDGIEGKLDNLYTRLGTINTNIANIGTNTDTIISNQNSSNSSITNIYNLLNTYSNGMLNEIRSSNLILKDQISVRRNSQTQDTITVSGNTTLGSVTYNLAGNYAYTYTYSNKQLTNTSELRYFNFNGLLIQRIQELKGIMYSGYNGVYDYIGTFATQVYTDLGYIGDELHLLYGLLNNFKTDNHNDIISFYTRNHNDIEAFSNRNHNDQVNILNYLNTYVQELLYRIYFNVGHNVVETTSTTVRTYNGTDYNFNLQSVNLNGGLYYFNLRGILSYYFNSINTHLTYVYTSYTDSESDRYMVTLLNNLPVLIRKYEFHTFNYNSSSKQINYENTYMYASFCGMLYWNLRNYLFTGLRAYFNYLNDNSVANNISNSVNTLSNNLTSYQTAEQQLQNRVQSSISSFIPDLSLLGGFVALSWVSSYLQQVYISLGSYGTVIMIGLLLAVCMQFIGYFRYKY